MHKKAFVLGLFSLFVGIILVSAVTETTVHPTALIVLTFLLFVIGIVVTGYSIWEDVA